MKYESKVELSDEQVDEMVRNVLKRPDLKSKFLKDFGFDDRDYTDEEMKYITYAVSRFGGIKDKLQAAKALYAITELGEFSTTQDLYEELGRKALELLSEIHVIEFKK